MLKTTRLMFKFKLKYVQCGPGMYTISEIWEQIFFLSIIYDFGLLSNHAGITLSESQQLYGMLTLNSINDITV